MLTIVVSCAASGHAVPAEHSRGPTKAVSGKGEGITGQVRVLSAATWGAVSGVIPAVVKRDGPTPV